MADQVNRSGQVSPAGSHSPGMSEIPVPALRAPFSYISPTESRSSCAAHVICGLKGQFRFSEGVFASLRMSDVLNVDTCSLIFLLMLKKTYRYFSNLIKEHVYITHITS